LQKLIQDKNTEWVRRGERERGEGEGGTAG